MLNLMKLENRIVLDAAAVGAVIEHEVADQDHEYDVIANEAYTELDHHGADAVNDSENVAGVAALLRDSQSPSEEPMDIVLISNGLPDYETIVNSLNPGAIPIIFDADNDSAADVINRVIERSERSLSENQTIGSLTIVSHGESGSFKLGKESIRSDDDESSSSWQAIQSLESQMTDDAKIILFGSDIGKNGEGQALIDRLAEATGSQVYASDDTTGKGGDWELEVKSADAADLNEVPMDTVTLDANYDRQLNPNKPYFPPFVFTHTGNEDDYQPFIIVFFLDENADPNNLELIVTKDGNEKVIENVAINDPQAKLGPVGYPVEPAEGYVSYYWEGHYTPYADKFHYPGVNDNSTVTVQIKDKITGEIVATNELQIAINPINDAPVLNVKDPYPIDPVLEDWQEDPNSTYIGQTVASIIQAGGLNLITDMDDVKDANGNPIYTDPRGIALTNANEVFGVWEYSTDNGQTWKSVGEVSEANALLLLPQDRIRFSPNPNVTGEIEGVFGFKAWDQNNLKNANYYDPSRIVQTSGVKVDTIKPGYMPDIPGDITAYSDGIQFVNVRVVPSNDAPTAVNDAYATPQDTTLTVNADQGILLNDNDIDGDGLTAHLAPGTGPVNGTLILNSDGTFTYTPNAGFIGYDSFHYYASDGIATAEAVVTIQVTPPPPPGNVPPVANPDTYETNTNTTLVIPAPGVLGNDTDPDNDPLTICGGQTTIPTQHGTVTVNADGSFTYTPNPDFSGQDTFTYKASDGFECSLPTTVTINIVKVSPGDEPPSDPETPDVPPLPPIVPPHADDLGGELGGRFFPGNVKDTGLPLASLQTSLARALGAQPLGAGKCMEDYNEAQNRWELPPEFCSLEEALREHLGCRFANTRDFESSFGSAVWSCMGWEPPYLDEEYDLYSTLFLREEGDPGFHIEAGELAKAFGMDATAVKELLNRMNEEYDIYTELFLETSADQSFQNIGPGELKKAFFQGRESLDHTMRGYIGPRSS